MLALHRDTVITISFLTVSSIQIWDTHQINPGIGWNIDRKKKKKKYIYSYSIAFL